MEETKSRIKKLIQAVDEERKVEESYFLDIASSKTKKDKVESGFLLYPVTIASKSYSLGEYVELKLDLPEGLNISRSRFREGVGCMVIAEYEETLSFKGTISMARRTYIKVLLRSDVIEKENIPDRARIGVEIIYDERPYKVMTQVLEDVMKSEDYHVKELRYVLEKSTFQRNQDAHPGHSFQIPGHLNDSQKDALKKSTQTPYVSVIHGPPGTGKTTTLIALIKALLEKEKRILVCAPSNNAVDLLAFLLDKVNVNVVRVGNLSRIGDRIAHLTIEEQVRGNKEWNNIKKIKIQASDVRKKAKSFKRKFDKQAYHNRKALIKESKELSKWANDMELRLVEQMIENAQVVCATLIGIDNKYTKHLKFDTAIIDEASQSLEPECWNAILRSKRVILAGDHKQLPPTVKSKKSEELGLSTTLLDRLSEVPEISTVLRTQYRMHNDILQFSNQEFYDGLLSSDEKIKNRTLASDTSPFQLIDTVGTGFDESFNHDQKSYRNEGEIFIISEHVNQSRENLLGASIGIISPYAEQVRLIREKIEEDEHFKDLDVEVNSIDGFQGQEKDVIYISMVRSNGNGKIGFLADPRRLNVAMTRARMKLVIVGDFLTLGADPIFQRLIDYAEKLEAYKSAWDYMQY